MRLDSVLLEDGKSAVVVVGELSRCLAKHPDLDGVS